MIINKFSNMCNMDIDQQEGTLAEGESWRVPDGGLGVNSETAGSCKVVGGPKRKDRVMRWK